VSSIGRIAGVAEAHTRDLSRRRVALLLLVGLPLTFYGALAGHADHAVVAGTVATAFSVSGAGIFAMLAGRPIDQRLVLAGYRPAELVAGRLAFLTVLSLPILAGTATLMLAVSHPAHPAQLIAAVALLGLDAVPLGLVIGTLLPRELEATLVLIGIVGVQLSLEPTQTLSALLPLHAATRFADAAVDQPVSPAAAIPAAGYAAAMLAVALTAATARLRRHRPTDAMPTTTTRGR